MSNRKKVHFRKNENDQDHLYLLRIRKLISMCPEKIFFGNPSHANGAMCLKS